MPELQVALRYLVFAAFATSVLVALASWLVRTRRLSPFGALGRTLRTASDPLIRPIETRLVRAGGNPVHAGWWLVVGVAVAGVLLITLWNWLVDTAFSVAAAYAAGPRAVIALAVDVVYRILVAALWVRVLAGWFGYFRYSRWVRPAYALTDWVVEPIRRVLPPAGGFDWSPLAAWLALWVLKRVLLTIVVG
jgi:YggT family protein